MYLLELARSSIALAILLGFTLLMLAVAIAFVVAASLLRRSNNRKRMHWGEMERDWAVALDEIESGLLESEVLHASLSARDRLVFLDYLYKCATVGPVPERLALIGRLSEPYIAELEARAIQGDVWQRARAIRTLAKLRGEAARPAIEAALDDPAPHVALTAARAYARLRLGGVGALLERVDRYRDWDARLLRLTLAAFGPGAAPALHARFADAGAPEWVRAACAAALVELRYTGANETALAVLTSAAEVDLKAAALRVLAQPLTDAQRALVRELCSAADPIIRAQAVTCLSRLGDAADVAELERALGDLSPWVVLNATRALREHPRPAADLTRAAG